MEALHLLPKRVVSEIHKARSFVHTLLLLLRLHGLHLLQESSLTDPHLLAVAQHAGQLLKDKDQKQVCACEHRTQPCAGL